MHTCSVLGLAAFKLFLLWSDATNFMPGILSDGHLCGLWIVAHPRMLAPALAQPFLQKFGVAAFFIWLLLTSYVTPYWLTSFVEFAVLTLALSWRAFALVLQLRATPPIALVTPILGMLMPMFHYEGDDFFSADDVPAAVAKSRKESLAALSKRWGRAGEREGDNSSAVDRLSTVRKYIADVRFTKTTSSFFPFQKTIASRLDPNFILERVTDDNHIVDVDGTKLWDAACSFGVNVIGYKHYKEFLARGFEVAKNSSVCLGQLTPQVERNAERICAIANKEQCSFHMSGTEAIMGAVRLARFNTKRPLICVFGGAYHGWYDGVMQLGTTRPVNDLLVVKFGSQASLDVIRARSAEIAAVLVNPLCALDVNKPPPADFSLLSNVRGKEAPNVEAYGAWLRKLVAVCRECGIVSIFDEVYVGFRYSRGGAQEFFDCNADVVCYGKTLGGGLPCGVICGPSKFLRRSGGESPLKKAIVIGTFSSHPVVMATMDQFLNWTGEGDEKMALECSAKYKRINSLANSWVAKSNSLFEKESMPIRLVNVGSIWGIRYNVAGRYHWMLQFFILDEGFKLASIGSGRMNLSLETTEKELTALTDGLLRACRRMRSGGWWTEEAKIKTTPQIFKALATDAARTWALRGLAALKSLLSSAAGDKTKSL